MSDVPLSNVEVLLPITNQTEGSLSNTESQDIFSQLSIKRTQIGDVQTFPNPFQLSDFGFNTSMNESDDITTKVAFFILHPFPLSF